jgi:RimJ/RimL family protein N-acetyltransferase
MTDRDELRTERLLMRRWRPSDREPFAALNADPEVTRFLLGPLTRAESDGLVDRLEARFDEFGFGLWALEVLTSGDFIGFTGLNPMPVGVPGAGGQEVGWRLARHAWHQGYATEAAHAALAAGFTRFGLAEIWSITACLNTASQNVMKRIAMVPFAEFEHPAVPPGHPLRPHVAYRIDRQTGSATTKLDVRATVAS